MPNKFEIKTKRLIIRPLKSSDFKIWQQTYSNLPKAKNKWDISAKNSRSLTRNNFNQILALAKKNRKNDFMYDFVAFKKNSHEIIGYVSAMDISRAVFQNAYLGYSVFSPYWGQGYGKEMVSAMIRYSFTVLKLHRLEAGIEPTNTRSIRLAKSLGLRREGLSKRRLCLRGEWQDIALYAITCEELGIKSSRHQLMQNRR